MKKIILLCSFLLTPAFLFADMTVVQKIDSGPIMGQPASRDTMTMQIKGSKARIDFQEKKISQIIDLETKKMYMLDPPRKQVTVMSTDMMKQAGDMFSKLSGGEGIVNANFQKTGKSQTINGYPCEEYLLTAEGAMNLKAVYWITKEVDVKEFEPFRAFGEALLKNLGAKNPPPGMPIRSETKLTMMGQNVTSNVEVQSISHDAIADSVFEVPKDYKVTEMPKFQ